MPSDGRRAEARAAAVAGLRRATRPFQRVWPSLPEAVVGSFALVVILLAAATQSTTVARRVSEVTGGNRYLSAVDGLVNPFRTKKLLLESGLPVYDLRIGRTEYVAIENVVKEARRRGILSEDLQHWVPARLYYEGDAYNAKVRVRGDLPAHWQGEKKSWAIRLGKQTFTAGARSVRTDGYLKGRRQINLIIPLDREWAVAPFLNDVLRDGGLMSPRDNFAVLRINGVVQGVYYEVEQLGMPLTVAYKRPEASVHGQNGRSQHFAQYTKNGTPIASDASFDVAAMRPDAEQADELAMQALDVLAAHARHPTAESLRRVQLVLDWPKYVLFKAVNTLTNSNHTKFGSDNMKLFHNPSTGLLEPVPWDMHLVRMPREPATVDFWNSHGPDPLEISMLTDPTLRLERNRVLWSLVDDGGKRLMKRYDKFHDAIRPLAWADVLSTPVQAYKMDLLRATLKRNIARVHHVLGFSAGMLTFRRQSDARAAIDVSAVNFSGLRLGTLELAGALRGEYGLYADTDRDGAFGPRDTRLDSARAAAGKVRLAIDRLLLPRVRYDGDTIGTRYWEYFEPLSGRLRLFLTGSLAPGKPNPIEWAPPAISLTARNAVTGARVPSALLGGERAVPEQAIAVTAIDDSKPMDIAAQVRSRPQFLGAHPQFRASDALPNAVEPAGPLVLRQNVIVPRGVPFVLGPGADVTLGPGVSLVAYGGLRAVGTAAQPVRVRGDGSGEPWGTFASLRSPFPVVMRHVDISGGGQAELNATLFTGGVAVHGSDLVLERCRVHDMASEDGVNLKNGRLTMRGCLVERTASDAFDLDFGTGVVRDNRFRDIEGDAFDMSGSRVLLSGNRFEDIGDKCVSVGENSHPTLVANMHVRCAIGISAKDLSHPRVAFSTFLDNKIAIEAKRKKAWYGPGSADLVGVTLASNTVNIQEDVLSDGGVRIRDSRLDRPYPRCVRCVTGGAAPKLVEPPAWAAAVLGTARRAPGAPQEALR